MSLGEYLKEQRLARNRTLDEIADQTKILKVYLQAIENDEFDKLPAETFAKGFIRAYAGALGLDAEDIAQRYHDYMDTLTEPLGNRPSYVVPSTKMTIKSPREKQVSNVIQVGIGVGIAVLILIVGGVFLYRYAEENRELWQEAGTESVVPADSFAESEPPAMVEVNASPTEAPVSMVAPEVTATATNAPSPTPIPIPTNSPTPILTATPSAYPTNVKPSELQITAKGDVTVTYRVDGESEQAMALKANDKRTINVYRSVEVKVSDRDKVELLFDKRKAQFIGSGSETSIRLLNIRAGGR